MSTPVHQVDTFIIGAGVIGSSVAMHLARNTRVRVIDFDLEGSLSSSELNAGGVRTSWNQLINVELARQTIDYFAKHAEEVGYRDCGYLWLHTPEKFPAALKQREKQSTPEWPIEAWDVAELRRRVPFIDKTDDLAGAIFGRRDGLVNPNRVKNHFREKARASGADFDDRTLLRSCSKNADGSLTLVCEKFPAVLGDDQKRGALAGTLRGAKVEYHAKRVVNCAGPWASAVAKILGYSSPSFAQRRQICVFDCRDVDMTPYGMIVDTSGVYFHPEATNGLAGWADHAEPHGINFEYDGEAFFMERIWPALYERSTKFEKLKHLTGWAGLYEVSPDETAIIGSAAGDRIFEAHSFSGHGVMHSYAAGLALSELMSGGKYSTIDASCLNGTRFEKGQEIRETLVI